MSSFFTTEEAALFINVPEEELVDLAIDLDVPVPEVIDRAEMLDQVVRYLADLGRRQGLPFSEYDKDDLEALEETQLRTIAALNGVGGNQSPASTVTALIKAGKKVYRWYGKNRPNSQIPLYLPMLLEPLARYLVEAET